MQTFLNILFIIITIVAAFMVGFHFNSSDDIIQDNKIGYRIKINRDGTKVIVSDFNLEIK